MPDFNTLEAAVGFITCMFTLLPLALKTAYTYVVVPLKEDKASLKEERDNARNKLENITDKIFEKSGVFDA